MAAPKMPFNVHRAIQDTEDEANIKSAEILSLEGLPRTEETLRQEQQFIQELGQLQAQLRKLRALAGQAGERLFLFFSHSLWEIPPFPSGFLSQDPLKPNPSVVVKPPPHQLRIVNNAAIPHELHIGQLIWEYNLTNT
jgi:hypothetical protein